MAKPVAINHSRIRRDCCDACKKERRLLLVLKEGHDLCCFTATGRSDSEICEIGEQGVSTVGSAFASTAFRLESMAKLQLNLRPLITNSRLRKRPSGLRVSDELLSLPSGGRQTGK